MGQSIHQNIATQKNGDFVKLTKLPFFCDVWGCGRIWGNMEAQNHSNSLPTEHSKGLETKPASTPGSHSTVGLSISECRKHLGETNLADKEIEELRDALFVIIDNIFDRYFDELNTYDPTED